MYFIQLFTTKKCNKNCYYCTTYSNDDTYVDIDYLKWALDQCPTELGVELTGGEVGMIQNLDDVYTTVKDHPSVKHIIVLSNGLLRKRGVDWLNDVEYCEHLIHDIRGKEIVKFYDDLDLEQEHKYVIVATETTTKSLLAHWDHFKEMGLFRDNFFYKVMNHKSDESIEGYFNDLSNLYLKLNDVYFQRMLVHYYAMKKFHKIVYEDKKLLCQKYSPNPFIDLQTRELGHCALNVNKTTKVPFNAQNLTDLMHGKLSDNPYCQECYCFDNGKNREWNRNRSYEQ